MTTSDLVDASEIAQRLGVKRMTVHKWRQRGTFPEPDYQFEIGPVWLWRNVETWAEKTGRRAKGETWTS